MPFAFLFVGLVLVAAGVRGKTAELGALVANDFTGKNNFFYWLAAIGVVGAVGYVPQLQKASRLFLVLIIVVMFLDRNSGFFSKFVADISNPQRTPANTGGTSSGASGVGGILGQVQSGIGMFNSLSGALSVFGL